MDHRTTAVQLQPSVTVYSCTCIQHDACIFYLDLSVGEIGLRCTCGSKAQVSSFKCLDLTRVSWKFVVSRTTRLPYAVGSTRHALHMHFVGFGLCRIKHYFHEGEAHAHRPLHARTHAPTRRFRVGGAIHALLPSSIQISTTEGSSHRTAPSIDTYDLTRDPA